MTNSLKQKIAIYTALMLLILCTLSLAATEQKSKEQLEEEQSLAKIINLKQQLTEQLATGPADSEQLKQMLMKIMLKENVNANDAALINKKPSSNKPLSNDKNSLTLLEKEPEPVAEKSKLNQQ